MQHMSSWCRGLYACTTGTRCVLLLYCWHCTAYMLGRACVYIIVDLHAHSRVQVTTVVTGNVCCCHVLT
jgi:hypothetical protein